MSKCLIKIDVDNVFGSFSFSKMKKNILLSDIHFEIEEGETIMVAGPSGIGKSTILTLLRSDLDGDFLSSLLSGVRYDGTVTKDDDLIIRFASQALTINTDERVGEAMAYEVERYLGSGEGVSERVEYWLNMFGLENKSDMVIRKLSGGEKRRVQIAERCAIEDYQMMICDEPDTGLDLVTQAQLHKMLCRGAKQNNKALITVTHNLYKNMFEYDKIMLLGRGASENTATIRYFGKPAYLSRVFGTEDLLEIFKQLYKPAKRAVEPKETEKRRNLVTI